MEAHQAMKLQETHARGTIFVGAGSIWKAFPANLKPPAPSCANEPSKLNPCPTVCYALVLTKEQGKETRALSKKILPRLLIASWQRKDDWKTLFQNKPSGTINPVYLPQTTPEQNKECVNQQNTVYFNSCPILYPTTYEEHPINNNDLHRVALAQHLLYHSKGEMLRREQSKGHRKGTRAWQKDIQSL